MSIPKVEDFERLGAFYLGRNYNVDQGAMSDDLVLYDSKDLTTHAVCVGMTGSGKTGLCVGLIEEAAIDGIPAIVIDPKGDMGNLLLNFPGLAPKDFEPWIDPGEASRKERSVEDHAIRVAELWREGLAEWGQSGARVQLLADSVEMAIYTPGSDAGLPLTVLRSFDAPPVEVREERELFADRVQSATAGLLALLGIDADPIRSRESILVSSLLQHAWQDGRDLSIADLIREIQQPPFKTLGVLELDSFYPSKERFALAMALNGVLASPQFAPWLEGEPLDVQSLLYTAEGKPRIAVLSIAHLSESERMFFVTILLNEMVAWMRQQAGTGTLRAMLYMDEIFGYFPPTAEPPSKKPMLTLLKQARAYGLGVVLATQNPVDLDYKGLSNTGTWFIGRLQTERDKRRVLDGLEGAMSGAGRTFDRAKLDATLSGLGKRVFLMNNVHEDEPVVFQTRWALSYLRGPLTRSQIRALVPERQPAGETSRAATTARTRPQEVDEQTERPVLPDGIKESFLARRGEVGEGERALYRPSLACEARLHYAKAPANIDEWITLSIAAPLAVTEPVVIWAEAEIAEGKRERDERSKRDPETAFGELPAEALQAKRYTAWSRELKNHLYQHRRLSIWKSREYRLISTFGESERDFRVRVKQAAREKRTAAVDKLREKYGKKIDRIQERLRKAQEKVGYEEEQHAQSKRSSWLNIGTTLLGGLLGRKIGSYSNARRASSAVKSVGRASKEKSDIERAKRDQAAIEAQLRDLEAEFEQELNELRGGADAEEILLEEIVLAPRKADISCTPLRLVWTPWRVDADGLAERAY